MLILFVLSLLFVLPLSFVLSSLLGFLSVFVIMGMKKGKIKKKKNRERVVRLYKTLMRYCSLII